jgi:hypothetical protein
MTKKNCMESFTASELNRDIQRLRRFAKVMETQWRLPFTSIRFGLDFVVGLVPVVGDLLTGMISLWLVQQSVRYHLPKSIYVRMVFNILIDVAFGSVPVVGDIFDLTFKANKRNLQLLIDHLETEKREEDS